MKNIQKGILLLLLFISGYMMSQKLVKKIDSVSYALGVTSSKQIKMIREGLKKDFGLTMNKPAYMLGFENGVDSTNFIIDFKQGKKILNKFFKEQRELAEKRTETKASPVDLPISANTSLKTVMDSISYVLGVKDGGQIITMKRNIKNVLDLDINVKALKSGHSNAINASNIKINEADSKKMLDSFFRGKQDEINKINKKAGEDFLAKNKTKKGVKTTASGLQYSVIKRGKGKIPTSSSKVKVHYHGTLIDGKVFDSSVDRGKSIEFPLSGVIKGWTEGLQLMKEGAKYRFYIPQNLAYGLSAPSPEIKPFSTLIFEVELLEVK